jgi:hypothetical protein
MGLGARPNLYDQFPGFIQGGWHGDCPDEFDTNSGRNWRRQGRCDAQRAFSAAAENS